MTYSGSILMLMSALTPLHAGTGRSGGVVDLPIQRDSLGYPIIYASSLKGALKTHVHLRNQDGIAKKLFGPDPNDSEKYSAPVAVTDAYMLLIPARSAKGNPALLTSPFMLRRVVDLLDLALATRDSNTEDLNKMREALIGLANEGMKLKDSEALVFSDSLTLSIGKERRVILCGEQLSISSGSLNSFRDSLNPLGNALPESFRNLFPERLVVVSDDTALRLIDKAIIRVTRVRLDRERKIVENAGLWTEEYLPHGTLLASLMLYSSSKAKIAGLNGDLRGIIMDKLGVRSGCGYVIFGGKESIGRGITKVYLL